MRDLGPAPFFVFWLIFVVGVAVFVSRRRAAAMKIAARNAGLSGIRTRLWGDVLGSWRGYMVTLRIRGGGRDGPERAVVEIAAATPARLGIHKRLKLDINLSPFGPPIVQTAFDGEYVVRSDDNMLAQRLLGDEKITTALRLTILERMDRLELATSRVRVTRVTRSTSREQALSAAWQLATVVVERLGLPPVESG